MDTIDSIKSVLIENESLKKENSNLKEKVIEYSNKYNNFLDLLDRLRRSDIPKKAEIYDACILIETTLDVCILIETTLVSPRQSTMASGRQFAEKNKTTPMDILNSFEAGLGKQI